jgi:hypothetical protein
MAKDETKRLSPTVVTDDEAALDALQKISDYAPANMLYSLKAAGDARDAVRAAREAENQLIAALAAARDTTVAKDWAFHNVMLGVKDSVKAQYGKDSHEVQALGLKKASEYKPKSRKPSAPPK